MHVVPDISAHGIIYLFGMLLIMRIYIIGDVLHWLPFPQRISYRVMSLVWRGLSGWALYCLRELCRPLSSGAGVVHCGSLSTVILVIPFARFATMQTRSFSVVGPATWNGLPIDLRHLPNGACSQFHHLLETLLFRLALVGSAAESES